MTSKRKEADWRVWGVAHPCNIPPAMPSGGSLPPSPVLAGGVTDLQPSKWIQAFRRIHGPTTLDLHRLVIGAHETSWLSSAGVFGKGKMYSKKAGYPTCKLTRLVDIENLGIWSFDISGDLACAGHGESMESAKLRVNTDRCRCR